MSIILSPPNNNGLIAYWPMNEGQGDTVCDYSGNKKHGFITKPSNSVVWSNGILGPCLYLGQGGGMEYVNIFNSTAFLSGILPSLSGVVKR